LVRDSRNTKIGHSDFGPGGWERVRHALPQTPSLSALPNAPPRPPRAKDRSPCGSCRIDARGLRRSRGRVAWTSTSLLTASLHRRAALHGRVVAAFLPTAAAGGIAAARLISTMIYNIRPGFGLWGDIDVLKSRPPTDPRQTPRPPHRPALASSRAPIARSISPRACARQR